MIVHENVNPDRSTLLFLVRKEEFQKSIRAIYDFLQSPEINKRSSLRSRDLEIDSAKILRYKSINHDDYSSRSCPLVYLPPLCTFARKYPNKFGISLAYSYLCRLNEEGKE